MPDYAVHTIGIISLIAAILATWGIIRNFPARVPSGSSDLHPVSGWTPTGHIDFASPRHEIEVPQRSPLVEGSFVLRVEDYRVLQDGDDADAKRIEFRWRNATVQEAKRVAAHYNADAPALEFRLPLAATAPPLAPEPDLVAREAPDRSRSLRDRIELLRSFAPARSARHP